MTCNHWTSVLLLACFIPVCFCINNKFDCGCGEIVNTSPYMEGDNMTLTCVITNPSYLNGINSSQLYFMIGDSEVNSRVINSTALAYSKIVTLRDNGMYRCQIRTDKSVSPEKKTVTGVRVYVFSKISFTGIDCKLYYWKQLNCSWKRSHQNKLHPTVVINLHSPDGSIYSPDFKNKTSGSWNIGSSKLDAPFEKPWTLSITQHLNKKDRSFDNYEVYPLKNVIPAPVDDLAVDIIKNNATCLRVMWSYDLYENFKKSFNITYKCVLCSKKISSMMVDKTNISICDLETGSAYNFTVRVKSPGGHLSEPVTIEQTTMKIDVKTVPKVFGEDKVIALAVGLGVAAVFAIVGICCITRKCKVEVTEFFKPFEIVDPSFMQETQGKSRSCRLGNTCQSAGGSVESTSSQESEKSPFIKSSQQGYRIPVENCLMRVESDTKIERNMGGSPVYEDDIDMRKVKTRFDQLDKYSSSIIKNSGKDKNRKLCKNNLKQNIDNSNISQSTDISEDRHGTCEDYSKVAELSDYSGQIDSGDETFSSCDQTEDLTSHNAEVVDCSVHSFNSIRDAYSQPPRKYCETSSDSSSDEESS